MSIFSVLWLALKDLFEEFFLLVGVNTFWLLINAPLVIIAILTIPVSPLIACMIALLAVLLLGPTNAGLCLVAQRIIEGRAVPWRLFFAGFREYRTLSWQVYGLWMLGFELLLVGFQFYNQLNLSIGSFLTVLLLYILLVWLALLIYIGPLMILQHDKRIQLIARNALLLTLSRPIFSLVTLILMIVVSFLASLVVLLVLLLFSFLSLWSFRATLRLIADDEARRAARDEKAASGMHHPANTEEGRGGQIRPRR